MGNTERWETASPEVFRLAAKLLRMAGDEFSNHGCNDLPEGFFENPEDETELYRIWLAEEDPEDYSPDAVGAMRDDLLMDCFADLFDEFASNMQAVEIPSSDCTERLVDGAGELLAAAIRETAATGSPEWLKSVMLLASAENAAPDATSVAPELRRIYRTAVAEIKALLPGYPPELIRLDIYLNGRAENGKLVLDENCEQTSDEIYIHKSIHGDIVAWRNK